MTVLALMLLLLQIYSIGTASTREIGNYNFLSINVWVSEVGNTADTPNPPWVLPPFKGNLGVPSGQRKFDH